MCGILTLYKQKGIAKEDVQQALASLQLIKHRGPDGEGLVLIDTKNQAYKVLVSKDTPNGIKGETIEDINFETNQYDLLLGHRRLSIFDLSIAGHQPFFYSDYTIIFNGEVYNFPELKEQLLAEGYPFNTSTDTEVIVAAYQHWGTKCFEKFNGMWAIVMYNFKSGEVLVSNDRFGVKPLYYQMDTEGFILMSEPKQIMAFPEKIKGINDTVVDVFMDLGYLFYNNETFFKNIFRFPKASYYQFQLNSDAIAFDTSPQLFYELPKSVENKLSEKEVLETFRRLMSDAVKVRLRSDVEWGISLSGGLDSTSIAFVAKEVLQHHNFTTFSVVSEKGSAEDESYFINLANKHLQSKNIQINPLGDFDKDTFLSQIYQIGSPVGDTSFFAQYVIKKVIKENGVTVLLSGQGGDEIMAGYHHHFFKYTTELMLKGKFMKGIREIRKWAELKGKNKKAVFKSAIEDAYLAKKAAFGWAKFPYSFQKKIFGITELQAFLKLDMGMLQLPYFLQADDSFSMAYAVETRNPFLDYRLVDFVFQLPEHYKIRDGWQKWILREAIHEMPEEIRYRTDKKGFTTPMKTWISTNQDMLNEMANICDKHYPKHANKPLFKRAAMGAWIQNFII